MKDQVHTQVELYINVTVLCAEWLPRLVDGQGTTELSV